MNKYKITFIDHVEAETELDAQESFMTYIRECAKYSDIEAFEFEKKNDWKAPRPHPCGCGYTKTHPNYTGGGYDEGI
jgi:hypothetical protein